MKKLFIALIITIVLYLTVVTIQAYSIPPYYLEPDVRQQYTARMNELIESIEFEGSYSLVPDDRIFESMNGKFSYDNINDLESFKTYCNTLMSKLMKWYCPSEKPFELNVTVTKDSNASGRQVIENGQRKFVPLITYIYSCKQAVGKQAMYVFINRQEASETDTTSWYLDDENRLNSVGCNFVISYDTYNNSFKLINGLYILPSILPEIKLTGDQAMKVALNDYGVSEPAYLEFLMLGVYPLNKQRTKFNHKYFYRVFVGEHGGFEYDIDATTGEIIYKSHWIE